MLISPVSAKCRVASDVITSVDRDRSPADFTRAISPFLPNMLRASRAILGSEDLAWDAVQETLLRLWVQGTLPDDPAKVLVHLSVKSSLHQLRCLRRRSHHEDQHSEQASDCCENDPLAVLEGKEERRLVREAVDALTSEYRDVLRLFEFEGESYGGVARRLGIPIGTVRSRLRRGRAMLTQHLAHSLHAA